MLIFHHYCIKVNAHKAAKLMNLLFAGSSGSIKIVVETTHSNVLTYHSSNMWICQSIESEITAVVGKDPWLELRAFLGSRFLLLGFLEEIDKSLSTPCGHTYQGWYLRLLGRSIS
jgi:hypothetical protein